MFTYSVNSKTISYVVNYETDLMPYIKINGSNHQPSNNYTVTNYEEILDWWSTATIRPQLEEAISHFHHLRSTINHQPFHQYIQTLKDKASNEP